MVLLNVYYFVCLDLKRNFKEVLFFINVENENGNVYYDFVKSGMGYKL